MNRIVAVLVLLVLTLAGPFLFRPGNDAGVAAGDDVERLVIISPHSSSILAEFTAGFTRHMRERHGREVYLDWRQPGGTTEISMLLKSEFENAFENEWRRETGRRFGLRIRNAFMNARLDGDLPENSRPLDDRLRGAVEDDLPLLSREMFLRSGAGIGIDLFFGGGAYDFSRQAAAGVLVARDSSGRYGPAALRDEHPGWFGDDVIPEKVSGEPFRDPHFRWVGSVLSSFGLCYNRDVFRRLGRPPPDQWNDLAHPGLFGQVALADPTKSGSATKAYEMLIQQRIQQVLEETPAGTGSAEDREKAAVRRGWDEAMRMIVKISANGRYFTDASPKVPRDVAQGDAAAGMCIDFYGRTFNEITKDVDGDSRIVFVMPEGGTSIGADPIGMLRGAPHPELAHRFIEFVLSPEGQKLWNFRPGTPGGPVRMALRRPPIRRDFYVPENLQYMTDADVDTYALSAGFTYRPEWTGSAFHALRFAIRCSCVDTHKEQREAWGALIEAGMPVEALREFEDVSAIAYERITGEIGNTLRSRDKIREVELARQLSTHFREQYLRVIDLCRAQTTAPLSSSP